MNEPEKPAPEMTTLGESPSVSHSNDELTVPSPQDSRLYVPDHEGWMVQIKRDSDRVYCYSKQPGQDWFHMILNGEIYLSRDHERYCLSCALRMGFLTTDRLFWQHRVPKKTNRLL